jgi:hypothetical protein
MGLGITWGVRVLGTGRKCTPSHLCEATRDSGLCFFYLLVSFLPREKEIRP